ncbi:amino acid ABC transporter permease [Pannonibacter sp.]|uniref:amino acid ABC transporter permease n=1 Tax=Pannonibacter sp. TaxID=1906786 RepID=UPI003F72D2AF
MNYTFHWNQALRRLPEMLDGALVTLQVASLAMGIGVAIGVLLAYGRLSSSRTLRTAAAAWVETARNTPALFQIYFFYFGLGSFGLRLDPFMALLAGIAFNNAGYLAETFRGGLQAIPPSQTRAARSLGLSAVQTSVHVVLPQMFRIVFYPMTNQMVWSILMSSLGVIVGMTSDLTGVTQELNARTFRTFEFFALAAVLYYAMAKLTILAARLIGWRLFRT